MSEKTKQILKKYGGWILLSVILALLITPHLYWLRSSGTWSGRQAICGTKGAYERSTDLRQIALNSEYWNFQSVEVTGKLIFVLSRATFYLRDGIFILPLDTSDCQHLGSFASGETLVVVAGAVAKNGNEPLIVVNGLRETVPAWAQVVYNAGFLGVLVAMGIGLSILSRWFLVRIGFIKPRPALSRDEINNQKASRIFFTGIAMPVLWLFNPIFGAGFSIFSVIVNWDGFHSQKRRMAITGAILCVAGFVVMTVVSIGLGSFTSPSVNFYAGTLAHPR